MSNKFYDVFGNIFNLNTIEGFSNSDNKCIVHDDNSHEHHAVEAIKKYKIDAEKPMPTKV